MAALVVSLSTTATTYTVNTNDDVVNAGGCTNSHCSLREAILASQAHAGADVIKFKSDYTISPLTLLPVITQQLTIDGGGKKVVLDGATYLSDKEPCPPQYAGDRRDPAFYFNGADGSMVTGLKIVNFCNGITVEQTKNAKWTKNVFKHNIGDAQLGIYEGSHYNIVTDNIFLQDPNVLVGDQVELQGSSHGYYARNRFVGGENAYEILINFQTLGFNDGSNFNIIENETIEKCFRGSIELNIFNHDNIIRNNVIKNSVPNPDEYGFANGIHMWFSNWNNVIEDNVISNIAEGAGIAVFVPFHPAFTNDDNIIRNNVIKNTALAGITINGGVRNKISGNTITMANTSRADPFFKAGIDLSDDYTDYLSDGITPNDSGLIANNGQNYPVLSTNSKWNDDDIMIKGTLSGINILAGQTYRVECFGNETNVREAQILLGNKKVTANANGIAVFEIKASANSCALGNINRLYITCTATDSVGNTSELSLPVKVKKN